MSNPIEKLAQPSFLIFKRKSSHVNHLLTVLCTVINCGWDHGYGHCGCCNVYCWRGGVNLFFISIKYYNLLLII